MGEACISLQWLVVDIVVVVVEMPRQVMETRVYLDPVSAVTEHFIALYVSSKTYVLPAT